MKRLALTSEPFSYSFGQSMMIKGLGRDAIETNPSSCLRTISTIFGLLLICPLPLFAVESSKTQRPSVIVIMADDLGYADVGFQGCKDISTPNIDQLASNGAHFSQGYVTGCMCGPSRAGFITGRIQSTFGYYGNASQPLDPKQGLPVDTKTIAHFMQEQGYVTGGVGKWHMGTADHQHPDAMGYNDWFGFLGGGLMYYPLDHPSYKGKYLKKTRPWGLRDMHHTLPMLHNGKQVKWSQYLTRELTDGGIRFIEENHNQPFFLFVSYNAPHEYLEAPDETIAKYPAESMTKVPGVPAKSRSIYAAMVDEMDQGIGRLMETLDILDLADNTIVWFLSDHGGLSRTSDNRPLRGAKGHAFEGGLRVPFVVRWPNKVAAGTVLDHPVTSLDIGATSLALAGGNVEEAGLHGQDITSYMTGDSTNAPHDVLFWHVGRSPQEISGVFRKGDYKMLTNRGRAHLFNIKEDPSESSDLSKAEPQRTQRMLAQWKEWNQSSQAPLWNGKSRKLKKDFQYADYEWLKGTPHYRTESTDDETPTKKNDSNQKENTLTGSESVGLCNNALASEEELFMDRNQAFANPPLDNLELPNVLLIGDSISIGYTAYVRRLLNETADVYRIPTNARNSAFGLKNLDNWLGLKSLQWDVIHFNWGLWDLCYRHPESKFQGNRDKVNGTLTESLEGYRTNLERIVARLKETDATLIWCTTTPVPEGEAGRKFGDDIRYNQVAQEIMQANGVLVNNLHSHAILKLPEIMVREGDVHFTEPGYIHLAKKVATEISSALDSLE